ncbi:MAG: LytTR family DNA-binding domain-containing protein [Gammaproteobacteria bacterium]|nr:LytTR family DNA-binding domain-containing protein [Gammaproteobacteria bacterium]
MSALVHYVACQRARTRVAIAAGGLGGTGGPQGKEPGRAPGGAAPVPAVAGSAQAFFDRLPRHVGRDVIYANVSGHYLHVVTTAGTCLVLMRLSDAVLALGDAGLQVHRSYWVAHRHIDGVIQRGQRTLLRLTGSHEIPVSRTHLASVRAAIEAQ